MTISPTTRNRPRLGFTLIELCVVLLLISLVVAILLPRYGGLFARSTIRSEARRLSSMVRYLRSEAVRTGKIHYLNFDIDDNSYWVAVWEGRGRPLEERTQLAKRRELPDSVRLKDVSIVYRAGKFHGRSQMAFYPGGASDEAIVHFAGGGAKRSEYSLHIKPFYSRSDMYDYYFKGYKK